MGEAPIVDLKSFPSRGVLSFDPDIEKMSVELDQALRGYGCCYFKNHGIPESEVKVHVKPVLYLTHKKMDLHC
jgi:hypothetical protein